MKFPLSIYIHWPFCKAKCPYCDFNSHVRDGVEHARWRAALLAELGYWAEKLPGREIVSVFFGGGTPSLMEPETAAALIDAIHKHWPVVRDVEITLEANPTSIEAEKFKSFRAAGINRASVGIQSLVPDDLKFLGRQHSVTEALAALDIARATFPRYTFDLIYARPGQSLAAWEAELSEALRYADGHLSLYQLTIEENTAFHHAYAQKAFEMPDDALAADLYTLTRDLLVARGLEAYEISNYAKEGQESRHNLAYWKSDDYIGIGPGAHGRVTLNGQRYATETIKSPERWLERVEQHSHGLIAETVLSEKERKEEAVMMGLRLKGGIDYADWQLRTGLDLRNVLSPDAVTHLQKQEFVLADETHIEVTQTGRLLLNRITAQLLAA